MEKNTYMFYKYTNKENEAYTYLHPPLCEQRAREKTDHRHFLRDMLLCTNEPRLPWAMCKPFNNVLDQNQDESEDPLALGKNDSTRQNTGFPGLG